MKSPRAGGPQVRRLTTVAAFLTAALAAGPALAQRIPSGPDPDEPVTTGSIVQKVDFQQRLDAPIPLDLNFRDEQGKDVRLADYFGKKPVVLTLGYYRCPLICGQELNSLARSFRPLSLEYGKDFEVVTVSIDPKEKPELAKDKKASLLRRYGREGAEEGWHFLTGDEDQIRKLAEAVGFVYVYNERNGQYAHAAGIVVATPEGKISRYFLGMEYPARDLQLALMEASSGKIGSPVAKLLMFCYEYDPNTGKYTLAVVFLIRVLGVITATGLGAYIITMLVRERRRSARLAAVSAAGLTGTRSV